MSGAAMTGRTPDPRGRLIFIVEDDPDVARIIRTVLQDFGFESLWCPSGQELFRQLKQRRPELCIVDLGLPDMDGMEIVRELQARHDCAVLILSGRGYLGDRVMGLELGADDYVVKPFEPRELVARVKSILRRCQGRNPALPGGESACARFAGWAFNGASNTLTGADGSASVLSTAEAQLLRVFLERPNRILTREQLLGERDLSPFDRSIDVRISRLRRRIEADPQNPKLIKTVYGAGYLFSAEVMWQEM